jgi:hemerythrin-like domain-containing protein
MKRADALRPLSREHLAALLAAKRLGEADDLEEARSVFLEFKESSLENVRALGTRLHDHVRFEERQLFPAIEAALDAETLGRLAKSIEKAEAD